MNKEELEQKIGSAFSLIEVLHPTGSRFICDPPVMDTDEDYVVLTKDFDRLSRYLIANDWDYDGANYREEGAPFGSFRKDHYNLIVTDDEEFYDKYVVATQLAKKLNLLSKVDRVQLFAAVVDGEFLEEDVVNRLLLDKERKASSNENPIEEPVPTAMHLNTRTAAAWVNEMLSYSPSDAERTPVVSSEEISRMAAGSSTTMAALLTLDDVDEGT